MIIEKKQDAVEVFYAISPFVFNIFRLLVKTVRTKPRAWAFGSYFLFVLVPCDLHALPLPSWDMWQNSQNVASLVGIQLDKNIFRVASLIKTPSVKVENRASFYEWFSEIFGDDYKTVFFVSDSNEQMDDKCGDNCTNHSDNCRNWVYFHVVFWPGLIVVLVMNYLAQ